MKLAITGATGYIGTRLVRLAQASGHKVLCLTRQQPAQHSWDWQHFDLHASAPVQLPDDIEVLVHLAAHTSSSEMDEAAELIAAKRLLSAAKARNSRFIFISSQTARVDAPTAYGRSKWQIEQEVLAAGGLVLRPGLVYGAEERGLFGQLATVVRQWPIVPVFLPAPLVQPVHVDDLANAILLATHSSLSSAVLCIGAPVACSFTFFLQTLATHWLRLWRLPLPVPVLLLAIVRKAVALFGSKIPALERLASLFALPLMQSADDLARLGVVLRPLEAGMHRSGKMQHRALLQEANTLLGYILRARPHPVLLRRYVHAIRQLRKGTALPLPALVIKYPCALAVLDDGRSTELRWRLQVALWIAEASPQGALRCLRSGKTSSIASNLLRLVASVTAELFWRVASLLLRPYLRAKAEQGS